MCKICEQFINNDNIYLDDIDLSFDKYSNSFYIDCFNDEGCFDSYVEISFCPFCGQELKYLRDKKLK